MSLEHTRVHAAIFPEWPPADVTGFAEYMVFGVEDRNWLVPVLSCFYPKVAQALCCSRSTERDQEGVCSYTIAAGVEY
jgi:hypothetical protein